MLEFVALEKIQAVIHIKFKYIILYKYVKMYVKFSVYRLIINIFNKKYHHKRYSSNGIINL